MIGYAIYFNTTDYPKRYVVRKWYMIDGISIPDDHKFVEETLSDARAHIPKGFVNVGNKLETDPVIVECWI